MAIAIYYSDLTVTPQKIEPLQGIIIVVGDDLTLIFEDALEDYFPLC